MTESIELDEMGTVIDGLVNLTYSDGPLDRFPDYKTQMRTDGVHLTTHRWVVLS